jgi:hypothetical protein
MNLFMGQWGVASDVGEFNGKDSNKRPSRRGHGWYIDNESLLESAPRGDPAGTDGGPSQVTPRQREFHPVIPLHTQQ